MSPTRLSNLTIVVVEDHNDTRRFLGIFLGHLGAKVVVAGNAIEGLAAVKTYHPNLVLSDISMPGRDGFGLLSDIRALGPDAGGNVPVIAMTAFVDRARILNAGFKAFLSKPFSPETLVEAILTALNHSASCLEPRFGLMNAWRRILRAPVLALRSPSVC
jgi:CheY-like chemotaxis protein